MSLQIKKSWTSKILQNGQMSEAFINSAVLALSGGFQDAYTYNAREGVFSNAQTGNVVLMSQYMMAGEWQKGLRFLLPLLAFAFGVLFAEQIRGLFQNGKRLHWRQGILLAEIIILGLVGLMPASYNVVATIMVSFTCAMQVQAFRKVEGNAYASTMCIGNLRSGTESLSAYLKEKSPEQKKKALYYFGIILLFAVGAGIGGNLTRQFGMKTIWGSCFLLFLSFLFMFADEST